MIPLAFYLQKLIEADWRRGAWVGGLALVVLLVGLWGLFLTTVQAKFEHPAMYLPLPFGMLIVLLLSRDLWRRAGALTPA